MDLRRRDVLASAVLAGPVRLRSAPAVGAKLGIPGPYPGRVVSVHHPASIVSDRYQRPAIHDMFRKGLMELTGAPSLTEAWRVFFQPGDVVGIKVNPVGQPYVISSGEVFQEIVDGLKEAGIKTRDIFLYDRFKDQIISGGFLDWLPEGVRWEWATDKSDYFQLDMDRYDRDQYMEMPLVLPKAPVRDAHYRRSYVAKFLTKQVNKVVNLGVLKHHQSAGVTLAMKNLSHGFVNNVSRSHGSNTLNACGAFIPAVVDLPVLRQKIVLNILDGVKGAWHGGPGGNVRKYLWEHKTMYFATDPVALDKIGWGVIEDKRAQVGMEPIALAKADNDSHFVRMQPEHIEIGGALGLGEFDDEKIQWKKFDLA